MADPTDRLDVFTNKVFELIVAKKADLELEDVWFGEQNKIPHTPSACVIADSKQRDPGGPPRRSKNTFRLHIDVYHNRVQDIQQNDRELLTVVDNIEVVLHEDMTLDGLVYGSMVINTESGLLNKANTQFRGSRITFEGNSLTQLPMRPGYNQ